MFVVFEGIDGSGKTSIIDKFMWHYFTVSCVRGGGTPSFTLCRDPGGTEAAEHIRRAIAATDDKELRLFLYLSARHVLTTELILPRLRQGDIVVCDRYFPSTYVYQERYNGLDPSIYLSAGFSQAPIDLLIYFKVDPDIAYSRKQEQSVKDLTTLAGHYDDYIYRYTGRVVTVNANKPLDRLAEQVFAALDRSIPILNEDAPKSNGDI